MTPIDLPAAYHDLLTSTIEPEGFEIPHAIGVDADGALTMFALALPVPDAYQRMVSEWASGKFSELIFAFDRYALPDQGTTLGDLMAGWHFTLNRPRPFIIECRFGPREMRPIDWSNAHWNAALTRELRAHIRASFGKRG
ncbi:hypothetical protein [Sphingomonas hengshuiensis]|uniref:Uncharacterized protein n=1 Tax=Sphingomonas hengshuiensis TaxID=1609977 RepID=A0A7U4LFX1_9SPHN|nr:hypothetical protein [Sphingomonas hengshuiensis]AJP72957.1 hypothetical protein TS85_15890 [Sphingomonas hengshuiensis]